MPFIEIDVLITPVNDGAGTGAMGLGADDLRLLIHLKSQGHICNGSSVIEIGAQQLNDSFLASRSELDIVKQLFGIEQLCPLPELIAPEIANVELKLLDENAPWARQFWTWLGLNYAAIDIDGSFGSIAIDLNYDDVPADFEGKYHLVTNFGTTEHVANQLNAFKVIHDLTALGGLMFHNLPSQGMFNHGFVNYNPKFFWMLARSNGYKFVHMGFFRSKSVRELSPDIVDYLSKFVPDFAEQTRDYQAVDCAVIVVMQKIFDIAYVAPLDVNTGTRTGNRALEVRYWTVFEPDAFERLKAAPECQKHSSD